MIGLRPSLSVVGDGKCIKESKRGVGGESIEANLIILCHLLKMTGLKNSLFLGSSFTPFLWLSLGPEQRGSITGLLDTSYEYSWTPAHRPGMAA